MLAIEGLCKNPREFDYAALKELPDQVDLSSRIAGREGEAVELKTLLAEVKAADEAAFLLLESGDGFSACVGREGLDQALVTFGREGNPLPREGGGPTRFVIPDSVSCGESDHDHCANVKFLTRIRLLGSRVDDSRSA